MSIICNFSTSKGRILNYSRGEWSVLYRTTYRHTEDCSFARKRQRCTREPRVFLVDHTLPLDSSEPRKVFALRFFPGGALGLWLERH